MILISCLLHLYIIYEHDNITKDNIGIETVKIQNCIATL